MGVLTLVFQLLSTPPWTPPTFVAFSASLIRTFVYSALSVLIVMLRRSHCMVLHCASQWQPLLGPILVRRSIYGAGKRRRRRDGIEANYGLCEYNTRASTSISLCSGLTTSSWLQLVYFTQERHPVWLRWWQCQESKGHICNDIGIYFGFLLTLDFETLLHAPYRLFFAAIRSGYEASLHI